MSIAAQKATQIQSALARRETDRQLTVKSCAISETAAPRMWHLLTEGIRAEVAEFAGQVPAAASLGVSTPHENAIVVETILAPFSKLILLRTSAGVQATLTSMPRYLKRATNEVLEPLFFSTDSTLKPCLSNCEAPLTLEQALTHLLGPLFDLFDPTA